VLIAFGVGFIPLVITAWYLRNNDLLWLSLVSYVTTLAIALGTQLPRTLSQAKAPQQESVPSP
ncbi:MAG TPA: hypothetical protein V6D29_06300, partial [Leptolyngbyaceae cyanobacterium]